MGFRKEIKKGVYWGLGTRAKEEKLAVCDRFTTKLVPASRAWSSMPRCRRRARRPSRSTAGPDGKYSEILHI